jgi:hypothetical protein
VVFDPAVGGVVGVELPSAGNVVDGGHGGMVEEGRQ